MDRQIEVLMEIMLREYPYCIITRDAASAFIAQGGRIDAGNFKEWLEVNGYWRTYFNS